MTGIDLDAIEARANAAGRTLTWFRACARYLFSYPPGIRPNEYLSLAASANDVPALVDRVRELEAIIACLRRYVAREAFSQGGLPADVVDAQPVIDILDGKEPT